MPTSKRRVDKSAQRRAHQSVSGSSDVPLSAAQGRRWSVFCSCPSTAAAIGWTLRWARRGAERSGAELAIGPATSGRTRWRFCPLRLLSRFRSAGDTSGKGAVQQQFALLRALPCYIRAPAQQNFTQIPDRDIDCRHQVNLIVSAVVDTIVTKLKYFSAHSALRESPCWQDGGQRLTRRDRQAREAATVCRSQLYQRKRNTRYQWQPLQEQPV